MFTKCCLVLFTHLGTGTLNSFQLIAILLELEQKSTSTLCGSQMPELFIMSGFC